jgi:hypothetical protein
MTRDYIKEMLDENTGVHFMDSGGESGRVWQRNQKYDVRNHPEFEFDTDSIRINTYHWLDERVEYAPWLDPGLQEYMSKNDAWTYLDARNWVEEIGGKLDSEVCYTYNHENQLSQDIQFSLFRLGAGSYCILQSHNGADARGGMSIPRVFKVKLTVFDMFNFNHVGLVDEFGEIHKAYDCEEVDGKIVVKESGIEVQLTPYVGD